MQINTSHALDSSLLARRSAAVRQSAQPESATFKPGAENAAIKLASPRPAHAGAVKPMSAVGVANLQALGEKARPAVEQARNAEAKGASSEQAATPSLPGLLAALGSDDPVHDFNGDGTVNGLDVAQFFTELLDMLASWGETNSKHNIAGGDQVDVFDLLAFLGH